MNYSTDAYKDIAFAVVRQAVKDYLRYHDKWKKTGKDLYLGKCRDIDSWFMSPKGQLYTFGQSEIILKQLHEYAEQGITKLGDDYEAF